MYREVAFPAWHYCLWHLLLRVPTGQFAGPTARNHHSSTFRSFDPGTSPGGGAVTGTSPCYPLRAVDGVRCSFPNSCLSSSARAKSCLSQPPLPDLLWPVAASLRSLLRPLKGVWLAAPRSLGSQPPLSRWWSSSQPPGTQLPAQRTEGTMRLMRCTAPQCQGRRDV